MVKKNKLKEITRLYTQIMPNSYLSPTGSYSNIDHFIINEKQNWSEIIQVNLLTNRSEHLKLWKSQNNWKEAIKGIWNHEENFSDHRATQIEIRVKINEDEILLNKTNKRRIKWDIPKHVMKKH